MNLVYCPTCGIVYNGQVSFRCVHCPDYLVPLEEEPEIGAIGTCKTCSLPIQWLGSYLGWYHVEGNARRAYHLAEPNGPPLAHDPLPPEVLPEPVTIHNQPE